MGVAQRRETNAVQPRETRAIPPREARKAKAILARTYAGSQAFLGDEFKDLKFGGKLAGMPIDDENGFTPEITDVCLAVGLKGVTEDEAGVVSKYLESRHGNLIPLYCIDHDGGGALILFRKHTDDPETVMQIAPKVVPGMTWETSVDEFWNNWREVFYEDMKAIRGISQELNEGYNRPGFKAATGRILRHVPILRNFLGGG